MTLHLSDDDAQSVFSDLLKNGQFTGTEHDLTVAMEDIIDFKLESTLKNGLKAKETARALR